MSPYLLHSTPNIVLDSRKGLMYIMSMEDVMSRYYKKQKSSDETLVKAIDDSNNYSIASNLDPTPDGFVDHQWGADTAQWTEITVKEAEEILGVELEDFTEDSAELGQHPQHISIQNAVECEKCNPYGLTEKQYRAILDQGGDPSQREEQVS